MTAVHARGLGTGGGGGGGINNEGVFQRSGSLDGSTSLREEALSLVYDDLSLERKLPDQDQYQYQYQDQDSYEDRSLERSIPPPAGSSGGFTGSTSYPDFASLDLDDRPESPGLLIEEDESDIEEVNPSSRAAGIPETRPVCKFDLEQAKEVVRELRAGSKVKEVRVILIRSLILSLILSLIRSLILSLTIIDTGG